MIDDELVAEAVHDTWVRRLQHAYADVVNRRAWSEMDHSSSPTPLLPWTSAPATPLLLTGGPEVGEFIRNAIEQFEFFEFVILNAHIDFPDGAGAGIAVSRLFMSEVRQDRDGGRWTTVYGVYHDRYAFTRIAGGSRSGSITRWPVGPGTSTPSPSRPTRVSRFPGSPLSTARQGIIADGRRAWHHHEHAALGGSPRQRRKKERLPGRRPGPSPVPEGSGSGP